MCAMLDKKKYSVSFIEPALFRRNQRHGSLPFWAPVSICPGRRKILHLPRWQEQDDARCWGFGIKPFAYLKNRERSCEGCRQQNPRNSGFHFHPPGVAFWRAPFVANEAISTNPASHRVSKSRLATYSMTKPLRRILSTQGASAWDSLRGFHRS
jgi:hypothetical protein